MLREAEEDPVLRQAQRSCKRAAGRLVRLEQGSPDLRCRLRRDGDDGVATVAHVYEQVSNDNRVVVEAHVPVSQSGGDQRTAFMARHLAGLAFDPCLHSALL
jgi:hypothetical protein